MALTGAALVGALVGIASIVALGYLGGVLAGLSLWP